MATRNLRMARRSEQRCGTKDGNEPSSVSAVASSHTFVDSHRRPNPPIGTCRDNGCHLRQGNAGIVGTGIGFEPYAPALADHRKVRSFMVSVSVLLSLPCRFHVAIGQCLLALDTRTTTPGIGATLVDEPLKGAEPGPRRWRKHLGSLLSRGFVAHHMI